MFRRAATLSVLATGVFALAAGCATEDSSLSAPAEVPVDQPVAEATLRSPWSVGQPAPGTEPTDPASPELRLEVDPLGAAAVAEVTFAGQYTEIPTSGIVALAWDAPTQNADGSGPLDDLTGYSVWYGPAANDLSSSEDVGNVTSVELELPNGVYYVAVRAYDTWGNLSDLSNVIQITVGSPS